jgi:O-antigen/teichoic acid export membrane protein
MVLSIPALTGLMLLGKTILKLISTPQIASDGTILIPILGIGFILQGLEPPFSYLLAADKDTYKIAKATGIAVSINIILNLLLIPTFGIAGAAVATTAAFSFRTVLLFTYVRDLVLIPIPTKELIKSALSTSVMYYVLVLIPIKDNIFQVLIYPALGLPIFIIIFVFIGGLSKEEKEYVISKIEKIYT